MDAFAKFIESDAFFPILILLLVLFIGVFIWIIVSNKKEEKMRRLKRQNIIIDESAQIKIISKDGFNNQELKEIKDKIEYEENTSDEIKIIEEFSIKPKEPEIFIPGPEEEKSTYEEIVFDDYDKNANTGSTFVIPVPGKDEETPIVDKIDIEYTKAESEELSLKAINFDDDIPLMKKEEVNKEFDDGKEIEDYITSLTTKIDLDNVDVDTESFEETYNIPISKTLEEEYEDEIKLKTTNVITDEDGEEIEIPSTKKEISEPKETEINFQSAFGVSPTDNFTINENITYENPKEYTGEKTEVWDFDIDSYEAEEKEAKEIEEKIINAANEFIANIMKNNR